MADRNWKLAVCKGTVAYQLHPQKIIESCNDISLKNLNKGYDFDLLIANIKLLYKKYIKTLFFMAYDKSENFRRPDTMAMLHYINEFERLNHRIRHFGINLPTGTLVDKALNDANIFTKKQPLIGTTVNLFTYKCKKKKGKSN